MSEQLTSEESAAMAAMAADTAPVDTEEPEASISTEAAPAQVAAPTEVAESKPQEADDQKQSMVPQGALHQERERRKEAERRLQEIMAQIEAAKAPPPEIKVPDPILDPNGFRQFQIDQIKRQADELARIERQQTETMQQQAVMQRLTHDVNQFRATTPDYDAALQYAVKARRDELTLFGNPPDVVEQQIEVDMQALVSQAYSQGRNPAELFYGYAKTRGFTGAAPVAPQPSQAAQQVNALADAQKKSQSIGTAGGPSSDGGMTLETLAKMSERELAALPKAKRDEYMAKVMGG